MATKKLYRSRFNKKIAGVCGGIAEYFNIDATIVRIIWVVLAFIPFIPALLYIIFALVIPENPDDTIVVD